MTKLVWPVIIISASVASGLGITVLAQSQDAAPTSAAQPPPREGRADETRTEVICPVWEVWDYGPFSLFQVEKFATSQSCESEPDYVYGTFDPWPGYCNGPGDFEHCGSHAASNPRTQGDFPGLPFPIPRSFNHKMSRGKATNYSRPIPQAAIPAAIRFIKFDKVGGTGIVRAKVFGYKIDRRGPDQGTSPNPTEEIYFAFECDHPPGTPEPEHRPGAIPLHPSAAAVYGYLVDYVDATDDKTYRILAFTVRE